MCVGGGAYECRCLQRTEALVHQVLLDIVFHEKIDSISLELEVVLSHPEWVLGVKFGSSARATSTFILRGISPDHKWENFELLDSGMYVRGMCDKMGKKKTIFM